MDVRVKPTKRLAGTINPLSSKNYTTRYLLAAALADGTSTILHPAESEDGEAMRRCLRHLGADITEDGEQMTVTGFGRRPHPVKELDPGNAGAVARFLMAVGAFLPEVTFINSYPASLGKRPHGDLLKALEQMNVRSESRDGRLPVTLYGGNPKGGHISVSGAISSQFLSALLFLTPLLDENSTVEVTGGLKSKPAVRQTLDVLDQAGIAIEADKDLLRYRVPGRQEYQTNTYTVPGDYPGTAAIMAAAAVLESDVTILRMDAHSLQGERAIVDVLRNMGVPLKHENDTVSIRGNGRLRAVEFDGDRATDAVLAMTAAAVFAEGTSRFYNVENLRYKECDRISDFRRELVKAGAVVEEKQDEIIVRGSPQGVKGGVEIHSHYDHRVIMALTVVGLRSDEGVLIRDAHHVAKSYPQYFDHLRALGAEIEKIDT